MWFSKIFKKVYYNFCYSFLQSKMIYYTFQYFGERSKTHRFHNKSANAHLWAQHTGLYAQATPLRFLYSVCRASRDKFNITLSGAVSVARRGVVHSLIFVNSTAGVYDRVGFYHYFTDILAQNILTHNSLSRFFSLFSFHNLTFSLSVLTSPHQRVWCDIV